MLGDSIIAVARRLSFIRETTGPNRGLWVEWLQRFSHGEPGDSWCQDFVNVVFDIVVGDKNPFPRSGATRDALAVAKRLGWVVAAPQPGDLAYSVKPDGTPHHVGIVTQVSPLTTIAGNTSEDGKSSNGTGVFEHEVSPLDKVFVRVRL